MGNIFKMSYKDIVGIEDNYIISRGGFYRLREREDFKLNKITRAKIRKFKQEFGKCYLIDTFKYITKEYKKGMVLNFECNLMTNNKTVAREFCAQARRCFKNGVTYADEHQRQLVPLIWI